MKSIELLYFTVICVLFYSCQEQQRFGISSDDVIPPAPPMILNVKPLYGGATIFFDPPSDEDLLTIDAEVIASNNKIFRFSTSYFKDSLDIYGLGSVNEHIINLYATDRAGNRSSMVPVTVTPLEPSIVRVAKSMILRPGFESFYIDWVNELEHTVNIYVDFKFTQGGVNRDIRAVFSTNEKKSRKFIRDLKLDSNIPINIKVSVEDIYGNKTDDIDFGDVFLLQDVKIPKDNWVLPLTNDSIAGVPMCMGSIADGRIARVIDDKTDELLNGSNYMHTGGIGRTGFTQDGNVPWNLIIDLGDYYELSRIVTHQRNNTGSLTHTMERGQYYQLNNVGMYNMYYLDEVKNEWIQLTVDSKTGDPLPYKIPLPIGLNDLELTKLGHKGDENYMYPDDPQFTPPTRWFRYEALNGFDFNYTSTNCYNLSEITLYGRKAETNK